MGLCITPYALAGTNANPFTSFRCEQTTRSAVGLRLTLCFPFWLPFVAFAAYPVFLFFLGHCPYRRHQRRKKGLCVHCAYNLTGNVTGVCPECGNKI